MVQLHSQGVFRRRRKSATEIGLLATLAIATLLCGLSIREVVGGRSLSISSTLLTKDWNAVKADAANDVSMLPTNVALSSTDQHPDQQQQHPTIFRQKKPTIHVLGERHSGTKWITQHLSDCFNHTAQVRRGLTRWKHWFQEDGDYSENQIGKTALVVSQFRHPLQWVKAMHTDSYHAPEHFNLTWQEYVTKPWTMPRFGKDIDIDLSSNETICQYKFRPSQVIPCLEVDALRVHKDREVFPCYEMRNDGSGQPYDSILDLRRDKIRNFLSIEHFRFITSFFAVQYEDMALRGTQRLVENIEGILGTKAQCIASGPQRLSRRQLPYKYVEYMKKHVDWETEALIGYHPDQEFDSISTA
ncbi:hypothetical protein MPSEU_000183700 [Mayamaea pseudoterrestris]|nr:hypothetical protein MPSEU_000183700 [Mayamaea pseudoterrestris]